MIWVMPSARMAAVAGWRTKPPSAEGASSIGRSCMRVRRPGPAIPALFCDSSVSLPRAHLVLWTGCPASPIYFPQEGSGVNDRKDEEENRLSARAARYVKVGTNVGAVAARVASQRLLGLGVDDSSNAAALAAALGGLKGPIMKVAQLLATIPEALPAEYAQELSQLQSQAPPMGPAFVRRRMVAELGPEWASRFNSFEAQPAASASLGQVHQAQTHDGRALAAKLQYPDMQSAVEADVN